MITESALKEFKAESKKWLEDGLGFLTTPIKYVELLELTERLIAAEKDAARYRWMIERGGFGVERWGKNWYLIFEGPAPEHAGEIDSFIDEDIKCIVE